MRNSKSLILASVILVTFMIRVVPYALKACGVPVDLDILNGPWNVSPLMAVCLVGGMYFGSRKLALSVAMAAWLLSSIAMSLLTQDWIYLRDPGVFLICACYLIASYLGTFLSNQSVTAKFFGGLGLGLLSECIFFLVTNIGVWLYFPYTAPEFQYPWTMAGLNACFALAVPFFKMSLMSTAIFFPVMLLACELAKRNVPAFQTAPQPVEA